MRREEVRVLIGVEVGDGGVCCGDSDDGDNYWGQSGGKTWGVKEKKAKNSNDVVMNKTDGSLIQSLRRLWVYHSGGELLQGCIHTERRNLRSTSGTGLLLGQLLSFRCVCVTGWWRWHGGHLHQLFRRITQLPTLDRSPGACFRDRLKIFDGNGSERRLLV